MKYAKAVVAIAGGAVTAALGVFPPNSAVWNALTIVSAAITAAGVYLVPNKADAAPAAPAAPSTPAG